MSAIELKLCVIKPVGSDKILISMEIRSIRMILLFVKLLCIQEWLKMSLINRLVCRLWSVRWRLSLWARNLTRFERWVGLGAQIQMRWLLVSLEMNRKHLLLRLWKWGIKLMFKMEINGLKELLLMLRLWELIRLWCKLKLRKNNWKCSFLRVRLLFVEISLRKEFVIFLQETPMEMEELLKSHLDNKQQMDIL